MFITLVFDSQGFSYFYLTQFFSNKSDQKYQPQSMDNQGLENGLAKTKITGDSKSSFKYQKMTL
jgi:hypothetical protein